MIYNEESFPIPNHFVRQFRDNYINLYRLWTYTEKSPEGTVLHTPSEDPILEEKLPELLRTRLLEYKKANPDQEITLIKYMHIVNGVPKVVIEDERDLPDEQHLLVLSQNTTLNTNNDIEVVTDLLVARRSG